MSECGGVSRVAMDALLVYTKPFGSTGRLGTRLLSHDHMQWPFGLFANLPSGPLYTVLPPYDSILYGMPQYQSIVIIIPLEKKLLFLKRKTPCFLSFFLSGVECESLVEIQFFWIWKNWFSNSERCLRSFHKETHEFRKGREVLTTHRRFCYNAHLLGVIIVSFTLRRCSEEETKGWTVFSVLWVFGCPNFPCRANASALFSAVSILSLVHNIVERILSAGL